MPKISDGTMNVLLAGKPERQVLPGSGDAGRRFADEFNVTVASTPKQVREILKTGCFDLMILDYDFPAETGLLFFERLQAEGFNLPTSVLVSEHANEQLATEWNRRGGDGYYSRENFTAEGVEKTLHDALYGPKDGRCRRRNAYRDSATGLWGPRQLVRLLDEFTRETGSHFQLGFSVIEVRNTPTVRNEGRFESERELLTALGEPLKRVVGHAGYAGRYWGTMFWALFRNDQVGGLAETLKEVVDAFEGTMTVDDIETYAGAVKTLDPTDEIGQLQEKIDKALFKARKTRESNVIIGQL